MTDEVIRELQAARETKWVDTLRIRGGVRRVDLPIATRALMALAAEETFEATSALRQELAQAKAEVERLRALCAPITDLMQELAIAKADMERMRGGAHEVGRISMAAVRREKAAEAREVSLRKSMEALADGVKDARANQQWIHADRIRAALAAEPTPAAEPHAEDGHARHCNGRVMTDDGPECDCRPAPAADPDDTKE